MSPFIWRMKNSLQNHLIHLPVIGRPGRSHTRWVSLQTFQKRSFQALSTTHGSCFWLQARCTLFQLRLTSYSWTDLPSSHSHPNAAVSTWEEKAVEMWSIILGTESLLHEAFAEHWVYRRCICHICFCVWEAHYIIWDESPRKGA